MREVHFHMRNGKGDRSGYIYCTIRDANTNEILVCASLRYCADCVNERDYHIVKMVVEN